VWTGDLMIEFMDAVFLRAFGEGRHEYLFIVEAAPIGSGRIITAQAEGKAVVVGPAEFSQASIDVLVRRSEKAWTENARGRSES
jgi:hypothetical protein